VASKSRGKYKPITDEMILSGLVKYYRRKQQWPGVYDLAKMINRSPSSVHAVLGNMVSRGVLERIGFIRGWRPTRKDGSDEPQ